MTDSKHVIVTKKRIVVDENTFLPMMEVTVLIPLEPIIDKGSKMGEKEVKNLIGEAFLEAVEKFPLVLEPNMVGDIKV